MAVYASDVIGLARANLSDTQAQGRYSDASMLLWASRTVQELVRRLKFPEARVTYTNGTIAQQQEYQFPEMVRTLRVYVAGQLLVPTDLQTLEGHQILLYDQGGNTGVPNAGSGGPTGNAGTASPLWTTQSALAYPVLNALGYPSAGVQSWYQGRRPSYYWRGGYLGLVPAPIGGGYSLIVDGVALPPAIEADTDEISIPDSFVPTAACGVEVYALGSDRDDSSLQTRVNKAAEYEARIKELRAWVQRYNGDAPRGPKMFTLRSFYTRGSHRNRGLGV